MSREPCQIFLPNLDQRHAGASSHWTYFWLCSRKPKICLGIVYVITTIDFQLRLGLLQVAPTSANSLHVEGEAVLRKLIPYRVCFRLRLSRCAAVRSREQ